MINLLQRRKFKMANVSDCNFVAHMARYIGETVTVFTTSGGLSGQGFTGVLLAVNPTFIRLLNETGAPPACPLGSACDEYYQINSGNNNQCCNHNGNRRPFNTGAVSDIPVDRIASFVHNAV
jgi:hypothetical protein